MINRDSFPDIMTIVGYVISTLFVAFGIYILVSQKMDYVPKEFRTILGAMVITYGCFRSVIVFQKSRQRRYADEDDEN